MNCSEDYNDNEERKRTHPSLLCRMETMEAVLLQKSALVNIPSNKSQYRRSVLEINGHREVGMPTKHGVTWTQNDNRANETNEKIWTCHLEAGKNSKSLGGTWKIPSKR